MKFSPKSWTVVGAILFGLALALIFSPLGDWLRAGFPFVAGVDITRRVHPFVRHYLPEIGFYCYDNGSDFCERHGFPKEGAYPQETDVLSRSNALLAYLLPQAPTDRDYVEIISCAKGKMDGLQDLDWEYNAGAKSAILPWCKERRIKPFTIGYALTEGGFDNVPIYRCSDGDKVFFTVDDRRCFDELTDPSNHEDLSQFEPFFVGYGLPAGSEHCYHLSKLYKANPNNKLLAELAPFCEEVIVGDKEGNEGENGENDGGGIVPKDGDNDQAAGGGSAGPASCAYCQNNVCPGNTFIPLECTCNNEVSGQCAATSIPEDELFGVCPNGTKYKKLKWDGTPIVWGTPEFPGQHPCGCTRQNPEFCI